MRLDDSLSWLALTPGLASRLSARRLKRFDSPANIFRASLTQLESCNLPAVVKRKRSSARKKNWRRCAPFRTAR
jgi:hypothetical protein